MKKLLIVDDSTDLLYPIQKLLSLYDFDVHTAKDGNSFINEFKSFSPEIVLIDVLLNGTDGREICKSLREDPRNNDVTLILFSASPKHLKDYKEVGADGAIEKPFAITDFIHAIKGAVLSRKQSLIAHKTSPTVSPRN